MLRLRTLAVSTLLAGGCAHAPGAQSPTTALSSPPRPASGTWDAYGGDVGGMRFSPLTQIDRRNVAQLKRAWSYDLGKRDVVPFRLGPYVSLMAFEATPILVGENLVLSSPLGQVIAVDATTGKQRWTFDPGGRAPPGIGITRGVSAWTDAMRAPGSPCKRRIFGGTGPILFALDATTGKPCADFGDGGKVLLREKDSVAVLAIRSPPAIVGDRVIVGTTVPEKAARDDAPSGMVRAFDARTGAVVWTWDPIPRTDAEAQGWTAKSAARTGAANVWSLMSVDEKRDLVFLPTTGASPDFYGGERPGDNRYGNSVVALRASTGKLVWHFQTLHHNVWDYDNPSQPALVGIRRGDQVVDAVVEATKMGHLFVLERETGKPLFPVVEKPAPQGGVEGEKLSPTQPVPVAPPPLVPQTLTPADAWGVTPEDKQWCRARLEKLRTGPIFTPPSLEGTVVFPGTLGGMNWSGTAFDPGRQILITTTNRLPFVVRLVPRKDVPPPGPPGPPQLPVLMDQEGTPYAALFEPLVNPRGVPCNPPPWGTMVAIDMRDGSIKWEVPMGTMPEVHGVSGSEKWGSPNLGGAIVTAGGLVFAAGARDASIRAFDIDTGAVLWRADLPGSSKASPMTYVTPEGKQLLVIAAGGWESPAHDELVAFELPTR